MTDTPPTNASRLRADALCLAVSLDSFITVDWAEGIGPAVQQGKQKLQEMRRQRHSLMVTGADSAVIDWVLEALHARLRFLERLDAAMCRVCPTGKTEPERVPQASSEPSDQERRPATGREPRPGVLDLYPGDDRAA